MANDPKLYDHENEDEVCGVPESYLEPEGDISPLALPPVDVALPLPSDGFYGYYDAAKRFGIPDTIAALVEVGRIWKLRGHSPSIGIGDISKRGGGQLPGHASHRKGIDVDIRPLKKNGEVGPVTFRDPPYSRELSQELADLLHANAKLPVQFIFFNDPAVAGVQPYPNHDNHLHVRFLVPGSALALPVLRSGSAHPAVRELQRRLNFWVSAAGHTGPPVPVDGQFGNSTLTLVKAFQQSAGLAADGTVGAATWGRLPLASAARP